MSIMQEGARPMKMPSREPMAPHPPKLREERALGLQALRPPSPELDPIVAAPVALLGRGWFRSECALVSVRVGFVGEGKPGRGLRLGKPRAGCGVLEHPLHCCCHRRGDRTGLFTVLSCVRVCPLCLVPSLSFLGPLERQCFLRKAPPRF